MANDNENNIPDAGIGQPGFSLTPASYGDQSWDKRGDPYAAATRAPTAAPGAPGAPGALPAPGPGDISLDSLTLGSDGHLYGERRIISGDPNNPGQSRYDFENVDLGDATDTDTTTRPNLTALAQRWGFGNGAITTKLLDLQVQNAQTKANGYGKLISVNPDGSYSYQDATGTRQTTNDPAALAAVGITPGDIAQQKAQATESQKTLNLAGQYEAVTANADGSVTVKDGKGNPPFQVSPAVAAQLPGIAPGQVQYLMQQGQDRNYLGGPATSFAGLASGGSPYPSIAGAGFAAGTSGAPMNSTPGVGTSPANGLPSGGPSGQATQQPPTTGYGTGVTPTGGPTGAPTRTPQSTAYGAYSSALSQGGYGALPSGGPTGVATQQPGGYGVKPTGGPLGGPTQQPPSGQNFMGPPTASGYGTGVQPTGGPMPPTAQGYGGALGPPTQRPPGTNYLGPPTGQPPGGGAPAWSTGTFNGSGFTGSNQDQQQYIQSMNNYLGIGQGQYNIAHQQANQQNDLYRLNQGMTQNANQSANRNVSGMGFAGLTPTRLAGQ